MGFNVFDKVMSAAKDYHLPICIFVFLVGSVLQWFHHLDMAFVAYTGTILGAITGHAFSPAQKDHDDSGGSQGNSGDSNVPPASPPSSK